MNKVTVILSLIIFSALSFGCKISSKAKFSPENTALVVIDIQNAYLPVQNQQTFINNNKKLIENARATGIPVIYVRNLDSYNKAGSWGWKFHEKIKPIEGEVIIEKKFPSSFIRTELTSVLESLNTENLILTGLASSGCYSSTVKDAIKNEYRTVVVTDAHGDRSIGAAERLNRRYENSDEVLLIGTEDIVFLE